VRLQELIDRAEISLELEPASPGLDVASLETEVKYEGYLRRQRREVERARREERRRIPPDFRFDGVPGLSREVVERLADVRPETLGQAGRVPGVTPAAVAVLAAFIERRRPTGVTAPSEAAGGVDAAGKDRFGANGENRRPVS
jgi:tRNA uridine 5-carboxymethylaminomethyl modification enzyme